MTDIDNITDKLENLNIIEDEIIWKKHYLYDYEASNLGQIRNYNNKKILNGENANKEKRLFIKDKAYFFKNIIYECFYGKIPDNHKVIYINNIINDHKIKNLKLMDLNELNDENKWKEHYKFKGYYGNIDGKIYSTLSSSYMNGYIHNEYLKIYINNKNYTIHKFIYECFKGEIPEKYQIDHINGNKLDNSINNLQALSAKEHNQKTITIESRINQGEAINKLILLEKCNKKDEVIEFNIYKANELVTKLGLSNTSIKRYINNNKKYMDYRLSFYQEIIDGEVWKIIEDDKFKDYEISNMGRIKDKKGRITYGSDHETGYRRVHLNYKKYQVHYLVCLAFHSKHPIGEYGKDYTVDHIDQNRINNKADNLRWATKIEQANNTSKVKKIKAIYYDTKEEIGIYNSASEANRKLNLATSEICKAAKESKCYGKINNRKIQWSYID